MLGKFPTYDKLVKYPTTRNNLKQKFFVFLNSLVDLIFEAILVAFFILAAYLISLLIKYTLGEKWTDLADTITHGALIVVSALGALQFIFKTAVQNYRTIKKELKDEHERNH